MAFCEVHFFSQTLAKQVAMNVILPETGGDGPFATFYLLHGLSDDYTTWHRRTRIEWYVRELPLIVVMPDGFRGFYTNNANGPAYATFFAEELTAFVERNFPAKRSRDGRCVGGLSMGGYGALRLALGYPDLYLSANSHSGALASGTRLRTDFNLEEMKRIFGNDPAGGEHDLRTHVMHCKERGTLPKLRIDCGTRDYLIDANREFHRFLLENDLAHEYEEFPGAHDWDYWDEHVRDAIAFHTAAMGIRR